MESCIGPDTRNTFYVKKDLIIISAGKFGRETYAWAAQAIAHGEPWQIKGFLDGRKNALDA